MSDLATSRPDPYAVWRNPNYRLYACSWFLMTFGKMIETVTVGIHLYRRTGDPLALGWVGLTQAAPVVLLAIAGGQIADHFDRRRVLMIMLSLSTLVSLGLAVLASRQGPVSWIYLLLAIGATSQALGAPSRAALLPQIVGAEVFSNAVTWNSTVFYVASMTGPAVGGLIADRNVPAAFFTVVVCRILSLSTILFVRSQRNIRPEAVTLESLAAGIRFVWRTKLILATITLDLFAVLLGGATYLLPIYADDILHVGSRGLGFLRSAEAVGAITMAVLLAHLPPMRRAGVTMLWAVAGFGVATIVFGLSPWFPLSLAMMFLIGSLDNVSVVVRHTLVQMLTPDFMRGRVSAVNNIFIVASNDLGGLESGASAKLFALCAPWILGTGVTAVHARTFGSVASVVFGGVGAILVVIAAACIFPQILSIGSLKDIRPEQATEAEQQVDEELAERG